MKTSQRRTSFSPNTVDKENVDDSDTMTAAANCNNNNVLPRDEKVTVFMKQSLQSLHTSLTCPLCLEMLHDPSTLACAHTFCWKCIESFSSNNSLCPVKECSMPLAVTGSRKGGFLKINPSIETVLSSFQTICSALDQAPDQWWQHGKATEDNEENEEEGQDECVTHCSNNSHNNNSHEEDDGHNDSSDDEMIIVPPKASPAVGGGASQESSAQGAADELAVDTNPNWMDELDNDGDDHSEDERMDDNDNDHSSHHSKRYDAI